MRRSICKEVLEFMRQNPKKVYKARDVAEAFRLTNDGAKRTLDLLANAGDLEITGREPQSHAFLYALPDRPELGEPARAPWRCIWTAEMRGYDAGMADIAALRMAAR